MDSAARFSRHHAKGSRAAGFTLKELLVVIAVVMLIVCVRISALTGGSDAAKIAQCAANLKQYVTIVQVLGNDGSEALPAAGGGYWPWDIGNSAIAFLTNYGLARATMYCPGAPEENIDQHWLIGGGRYETGYAAAFPSTGGVLTDDLDSSLVTQNYTLNGSDPSLGPAGTTVYIPPSRRMILADATFTMDNAKGTETDISLAATYQWTENTHILPSIGYITPFGPWKGGSTDHMGAVLPLGGNVAMLDGSVHWRPFTNMLVRSGSSSDPFWW